MATCCGKVIGQPITLFRYIAGLCFALFIYSGYFSILLLISIFDTSYRALWLFYVRYTKDEIRDIKRRENIIVKNDNVTIQ
ncbi:MAG: hypothetical protein KKH94_05015 [Candidatus Omnitrophica bacterium]|nr:hypothetical protein [Candidatus Omnitrophota bacterium]